MRQFDIYIYKRPSKYKYLVDVQSDIIDIPGRRMVIPLLEWEQLSAKVSRELFPKIIVNDEAYRLMTPEMSSIENSVIGDAVSKASHFSDDIMNAINIRFCGI
jgi:toxin CcdB